MVNAINVQPQTLNLSLYAGDGISFRLICTNQAGAPVDMTGTVRAQVRLTPTTADPPIVSFTVSLVDAYLGIVKLSLTGVQTKELSDHASSQSGRFTGVWDIEWDPSDSEPRTLCQGTVECVSDVSR